MTTLEDKTHHVLDAATRRLNEQVAELHVGLDG